MLKVGDIEKGDLLRCVEGRTAAIADETGRLIFLPTFLTLGELKDEQPTRKGMPGVGLTGPGHCGIMMYLGKIREKKPGKIWYEMLWNRSVLRVKGVDIKYLEKMYTK